MTKLCMFINTKSSSCEMKLQARKISVNKNLVTLILEMYSVIDFDDSLR